MNNGALYRTSAVVYAEGNLESRKTETIRRRFVEAVFVEKQNAKLTVVEIGVAVDDVLDITLSDKEIESIVSDDRIFVEELGSKKDDNKYNLKIERYTRLLEKSQDNIEVVVNRYLEENGEDDNTPEGIRALLNKYLYALMNSNILAYRQVLEPSSVKQKGNGDDNKEEIIDFNSFTEKEKDSINRFLSWNDSAKDKELYKLVSCCIEYAIAINNSKENALIESFKNKVFYLDNALVYRAIGINGETRKKRTLSFIRKCRESGQSLCISKYSYLEFLRTIDFHLNQLNRTTPFGKINPKIFQRYSSGEGFFQFYHTWRGDRATYSFEIFKNFIKSEYNSLLKMYDIVEDYKVPFSEDEDIPAIGRYTEEIKAVKKGRGHHDLHEDDARNMYWIECKRNGNDGRMSSTKYYFVTSDLKLQMWDYSHSHNQPITLLPSQWMALLLKYYSRTNDDFKSFVSFLNIPRDDHGLAPEELQDILAGISQTTEDFKIQDQIVETFLETDWQNQRHKGSTSMQAKVFAKEKLEEQFAQQILEKEKAYGQEITELKEKTIIQIESIKEAFRQQFEQMELQSKREKLAMISQQLQDVSQQKQNIEIQVDRYMHRLKTWLTISGVILLILWIGTIIYCGTQSLGYVSAILGAIGVIAPSLYCIIYEKAFSLEKTVTAKRAKKEKEYKERYSFNDSRLGELLDLYQQLTVELTTKE